MRTWQLLVYVIAGGTSLSGGIGTIWGTLIGVFIMSVLSTGLPSLNLEAHYQTFFSYLRPVNQWNEGKVEEFKQRKTFRIEQGAGRPSARRAIEAARQEAASAGGV